MNQSHAVGAIVGTPFGAALAAVIASYFSIDPNVAVSWVVVLSGAATFAGGLAVWWFKWKFPGVEPPPLADTIPPNPGP